MCIEVREPNERLCGPGVKLYNFFFVGKNFLLLLMNVETRFDVTYRHRQSATTSGFTILRAIYRHMVLFLIRI